VLHVCALFSFNFGLSVFFLFLLCIFFFLPCYIRPNDIGWLTADHVMDVKALSKEAAKDLRDHQK